MEKILLAGTVVLLLRIAYLDYRYLYIEDRDILGGIVLAMCLQAVKGQFLDGIAGLVMTTICAFLIFYLARWYYGKVAFGAGDVTLLMFLGTFVGFQALTEWSVFVSVLLLIGFLPQIYKKKLNVKQSVPLAPFLNIATLVWLVFMGR